MYILFYIMLFFISSASTSRAMESCTQLPSSDSHEQEQLTIDRTTTPCRQNVYPHRLCPGCYRRMYTSQITALRVAKRKAQSANQ